MLLKLTALCIFAATCFVAYSADSALSADAELSQFLIEVNRNLADLYNKETIANWQKEIKGSSDVVALTQSEIASEEILKYLKSIRPKVWKHKKLNVTDNGLVRQLLRIPEIGYEVLRHDELAKLYTILSNMSEIYKHVKLCDYENRKQCNLTLLPNVQNILKKTQNVAEIDYYWSEWRQKAGSAARDDFVNFVQLYRKMTKLNGFSKPSDFWFKDFGQTSSEMLNSLDNYFQELRPYFLQFHAYVRNSLRKIYGIQRIPENKPYSQSLAEIFIGRAFETSAIENLELPYPDIGLPNITHSLITRGLNAQRVFWNVAEFYRSIGLETLEDNFWEENAKPNSNLDERFTTCTHRAWKYYGLKRQTLSYCPIVDEERFFNMFEVFGELYFYRAIELQPTLFQDEPFPNFSTAVGKTFSLAATSPTYLEALKIVKPGVYLHQKARINRLFLQGLRTLFVLPVFYVLDLYRVNVLDGKLDTTDNCAYWQLVEHFLGAEPPILRSNKDFDPPAKLLIEIDDQYTSEIMSTLLQFQLFEHFCTLSGQYEKGNPQLPLDLCNLSNQRKIGPLVKNAMALGSSTSYKAALKIMTNETEIKLNGLLAYFEPLFKWLQSENEKSNADIGWSASEMCRPQ